jgi:hypothetical protein
VHLLAPSFVLASPLQQFAVVIRALVVYSFLSIFSAPLYLIPFFFYYFRQSGPLAYRKGSPVVPFGDNSGSTGI